MYQQVVLIILPALVAQLLGETKLMLLHVKCLF